MSSWTWTSWAELNPATAAKLGLEEQGRVTVSTAAGEIELDWFGNPTVHEGVVAVVLGNGKEGGGRYTRYGANPMKLLGAELDGTALRFGSTAAKAARSGGESVSRPYIGNLDQDGKYLNYVVSKDDLEGAEGHGHHPAPPPSPGGQAADRCRHETTCSPSRTIRPTASLWRWTSTAAPAAAPA